MSNTRIQLKKSGTHGNIPSNLEYGELAINYADGRLFYKDANGVITFYSTGSGGGTQSDSFATINVNSTLIFATSPIDTLSFVGANGISVLANSTSKTINIDGSDIISLAQAAFDKANTGVSTSIDQFARDTANNAQGLALTTSTYLHANNIYFQGVEDTQNTNIASATSLAQAAFNKANTGVSTATDQFARNTANGAYTKANNALVVGQAAYDFANTLSLSGGSSLLIQDDSTSIGTKYINFTDGTSGSTANIRTDSTHLTYRPLSGTLGVKSIDVSSNTNISSNTFTINSPGAVVIDSLLTSVYRSAFYQIQVESGNRYHTLNLNVLHDDSQAYVSVYGIIYSIESLGTFTANIDSGMLNIIFTPTYASTTVAFIRNAIAKLTTSTFNAPQGSMGFVSETVTGYFDAGFDIDAVVDSFDYGNLA